MTRNGQFLVWMMVAAIAATFAASADAQVQSQASQTVVTPENPIWAGEGQGRGGQRGGRGDGGDDEQESDAP